jgi:hypothetical protein
MGTRAHDAERLDRSAPRHVARRADTAELDAHGRATASLEETRSRRRSTRFRPTAHDRA